VDRSENTARTVPMPRCRSQRRRAVASPRRRLKVSSRGRYRRSWLRPNGCCGRRRESEWGRAAGRAVVGVPVVGVADRRPVAGRASDATTMLRSRQTVSDLARLPIGAADPGLSGSTDCQ
jgi:hypothetical protein